MSLFHHKPRGSLLAMSGLCFLRLQGGRGRACLGVLPPPEGWACPGSASPPLETPHDPMTTRLAAQAEHTATAHVRFSLAFWFQSWAFRP